MKRSVLLGSALLFMAAGSVAFAQDATAPSTDTTAAINRAQDRNVTLIDPAAEQIPAVTSEALYGGWRAEWLFDQDVYGPNGNQLGEIKI